MDGVGRCMDNIHIERFWRTLKYEDIYLMVYETVSEAHNGISKFIEFYNNERLHSTLEYKTPLEVYRSQQLNSDPDNLIEINITNRAIVAPIF